MTALKQSVELAAEAGEVWPLVIAVEDWPRFLPTVQAVEPVAGPGGGVFVGAAFRVRQPRLRPAVWTVTTLEAPHRFTWTSQALGLTTVAHHRLEPAGPGRCRLGLEIRLHGPLRGVVHFFAGDLIRDYLRQEAEAFQSQLKRTKA